MTTRVLDQVLARVLNRALESICREMGSAMIRTASSSVFVEGRDFSCALLDDRAEMVACANYDPSHLAAMALTGEYALMELGWENLREGDVIVVNDPYRGGGHLTDISVIRPVFAEGELLGLAMNRGHHIDVGGMAVAGFPGTAKSIFQEGIRIPPVKWYEGGIERRQVMDLVLLNVRFPRAQLGDFRAQLASCVTAEQRIRDLVHRYGVDVVRAAMDDAKQYSELMMRTALEAIPDGIYAFEDVMEDDGLGNGPYRIAVTVRIDGDEAAVDFEGTSAQAVGPLNSSYGNTKGSVLIAFLHTIGGITLNQGCFRPISVRIPRGSFLNPIPPAPVFGGVTETSIRIIDAVAGALGQALPESVSAGSYGTCINVAGGGWDEGRRKPFGFYVFQEGGWGGTAQRDGWTSVPNPTSNFNDYPVEVVESELPLRYLEVAIVERSAGAGKRRGGFGTRRSFEILAKHCDVNALGDRFRVPPYGLYGGHDGAANELLIQRPRDPAPRRFDEVFELASPSKFASVPLARGDRFTMATGGGGGYGDPFEREPELVLEDVLEGLITRADALEQYGVVLDANGDLSVVESATANERQRRSQDPEHPQRRTFPDAVPARAPEGQAAEDIHAVDDLASFVRQRVGESPCRTTCIKNGDPVRCPFHHPFALDFWDAHGLERWGSANCQIVQSRSAARGKVEESILE